MCTGSFSEHVVKPRHTVSDSTYNLFHNYHHLYRIHERRFDDEITDLQVCHEEGRRDSYTTAANSKVTGLIPVPALGPAMDIMLCILDKAYQCQQNAGIAHEIANLCLRAHSTLSQHLQSMEITSGLVNSIRQFEADLHDAQEAVQKYEQKN
ncbi:hypothetical protein ARMSODRAFT_465964 [Armillaria solidipes]|uniref:Uncharacterized protein n=1 Tax=Armillaria solidipes TaxID=1076256 RepID=A0A2H3B6N5_9AGAR|nr:hypothetical protein ARMSODRAFT_465964 [Armillaria solidipes]